MQAGYWDIQAVQPTRLPSQWNRVNFSFLVSVKLKRLIFNNFIIFQVFFGATYSMPISQRSVPNARLSPLAFGEGFSSSVPLLPPPQITLSPSTRKSLLMKNIPLKVASTITAMATPGLLTSGPYIIGYDQHNIEYFPDMERRSHSLASFAEESLPPVKKTVPPEKSLESTDAIVNTTAEEKPEVNIEQKENGKEETKLEVNEIAADIGQFMEEEELGMDPGMMTYIRNLEAGDEGEKMKDLINAIGSEAQKREIKQQPDHVFQDLIKRKRYPTFISHLRQEGVGPGLINLSDMNGWTTLQYAVDQNSPSAIRAIFKWTPDCDVNTLGMNGLSALHIAVDAVKGEADAERLKLLLERPEINVNIQDDKGRTPVHRAVEKDSRYAFDRLLERSGIQPDLPDNNGNTPLELAVSNGRASFIKPLIAAGADPKKLGSNGLAPLFTAIKTGDKTTIRVLLEAIVKRRQGKLEDLKIPTYVRPTPEVSKPAGVDPSSDIVTVAPKDDPVNMKDPSGNTPLHLAAKGLRKPLIQALIKSGARLNVKNDEGLTPYDVAVKAEQGKAVEDLLRIEQ